MIKSIFITENSTKDEKAMFDLLVKNGVQMTSEEVEEEVAPALSREVRSEVSEIPVQPFFKQVEQPEFDKEKDLASQLKKLKGIEGREKGMNDYKNSVKDIPAQFTARHIEKVNAELAKIPAQKAVVQAKIDELSINVSEN